MVHRAGNALIYPSRPDSARVEDKEPWQEPPRRHVLSHLRTWLTQDPAHGTPSTIDLGMAPAVRAARMESRTPTSTRGQTPRLTPSRAGIAVRIVTATPRAAPISWPTAMHQNHKPKARPRSSGVR